MTTETQVVPAQAEELANETISLAQRYETYAIVSPEDYTGSATDLKAIKAKAKELDTLRRSLTKPLDESKKRIMEFFNRPLTCLNQAEQAIKSAMLGWQREQERIRQEEQRRVAELQRKEEDRLQKLAAKAEQRGDADKAEDFKERATVVSAAPVSVPDKVEPVKGIQTRTLWKYKIVDVNSIPREYMMPNEKAIGEIARATKGNVQIPGVAIYPEETIAAGR